MQKLNKKFGVPSYRIQNFEVSIAISDLTGNAP